SGRRARARALRASAPATAGRAGRFLRRRAAPRARAAARGPSCGGARPGRRAPRAGFPPRTGSPGSGAFLRALCRGGALGYRRKMEHLALRRTWPAAILALAALVLIPWAIALGQMLPSRHVARHWDAAWTGFDVILACSLLATAYASLRRRDLVRGFAA